MLVDDAGRSFSRAITRLSDRQNDNFTDASGGRGWPRSGDLIASQPYCSECGYAEKGPWDVARAPILTEALSLQCSVCAVRVVLNSMRMTRVFRLKAYLYIDGSYPVKACREWWRETSLPGT